jgi:hypothetical protein
MSYPASTPTFAVFYTVADENHISSVRADTADQARAQFETHWGPVATVELIVPVVDVTVTA